jgi:hypothetical protein
MKKRKVENLMTLSLINSFRLAVFSSTVCPPSKEPFGGFSKWQNFVPFDMFF